MRRMIGDERWDGLPEKSRHDRRAEGPALLAELRSAREGAAFDAAAITVPILVGYSTLSKEHHQWAAQELARLAGTADLVVIDGASHGAHASHPLEFAGLVRRVAAKAQ